MLKVKVAFASILMGLLTVTIAYACVPKNLGFEIYATNTKSWNIALGNITVGHPKTFKVTVESEEKSGKSLVTYFLQISGPNSLRNSYLQVNWQDTDGAKFTIGKSCSKTFSGEGTLTWNSAPSTFQAGHKNTITLTLTFLTPNANGKYNFKMWVSFTQLPSKQK